MERLGHLFLAICAVLLGLACCQNTCNDIDSQACVRMQTAEPEMCQSSLGDVACAGLCGKCGITSQLPTTTTTSATPTIAPCEDVDTNACVLLHASKPDFCADTNLANAACKRFCGDCPVECFTCNDLVRDMSECNTTVTCQMNEACYTMEVFGFDTSHGFRGGCMPRDLCVPHSGQPLVGRSSSVVHTRCCDTDRCNKVDATTTTTVTTIRPTTARPTTTTAFHSAHCFDNLHDCSHRYMPCVLHKHGCRHYCGDC
ncbi:uncharacterized protein LOC128218554 [Mya arenaria]|uniref:uncharacterized protein LOC128218554 n=1 Tax=Mya arenaria TaxID=6604 RepID=UPI0022DF5002|nr:uncharacterized protein LOC128218554 [Mya arenaria]